ncbi:CoA transferase subunit A [Cupriavidus pinatubonensis]|uniref:Glutaconate CoA-transferase subunit A n=1 Tax=Cupriavidus pinatubonensis TaxID=248026 RepID=A0ABN7YFG3_9BURK|nr:CoA-transferase [Cupriavidus pinatubonensis]CAG9170790.1 Glutaconate CoA-transferase subunit A [Cupriavidus pinatubonensis]
MKHKVKALREALAPLASGQTLALGGALLRRQPNAAVHEIIRRGITDLTVLGWVATTSLDLLCAAGAVKRYEGAYAGMFNFGLAPNFRRAVEQGAIEVKDFSESTMVARFRAAASGLPFLPTQALMGSDVAVLNPEQIREITCPFTGARLHAVPPASADFTIIHGYVADEFGNVQWPIVRDSDDIDQLIASSAKRLIVTVEKIVPREQIMDTPALTYIPGEWVEAVVEAPYGAHPVSCDAFYNEDAEHLRNYVAGCKTAAGAQSYLEKFVYGLESHAEYCAAIGQNYLSKLRVEGK